MMINCSRTLCTCHFTGHDCCCEGITISIGLPGDVLLPLHDHKWFVSGKLCGHELDRDVKPENVAMKAKSGRRMNARGSRRGQRAPRTDRRKAL